MMNRCHWVRMAAGMLLAVAGCGSEPAVKPTAESTAKSAAKQQQPAERLHQIDPAGLTAAVASLPGKVVLVDFWATWCPACREQFAHSVQWHEKYAAEGLKVISLACDEKDKSDEILAFLKDQNASFQNLRSAFGSTEQTFEGFGIDGGALPHCKLYDRKGNLHRTFAVDPLADKQFTPEDIEAAIVELLRPEEE